MHKRCVDVSFTVEVVDVIVFLTFFGGNLSDKSLSESSTEVILIIFFCWHSFLALLGSHGYPVISKLENVYRLINRVQSGFFPEQQFDS